MNVGILAADSVGWLATAVFTSSYFAKQPAMLRRIQAVAAFLWLTYGVLIHSVPVIVANVIVTCVALASSFNMRREGEPDIAANERG